MTKHEVEFIRYVISIILVLIIIFTIVGVIADKRSDKHIAIFWREWDESGEEGHYRDNGIPTDSGYLFIDTIWSHKLEKMVEHKTLITINK